MKMRGEEHVIQIRNGVQSPLNEPQNGSTFPMEIILIKQ